VIPNQSEARRAEPSRELVLPSPILSTGVLAQLEANLGTLAETAAPLVLRSPHPSIFLAGAHLNDIEWLDASTARDYALLGRSILDRIRSFPRPVVAAVDGACAGGGLDLVLACDAVVASESASFAHPGVRRGLITGWGGTVEVPSRSGRPHAVGVILEGGATEAPAAYAAGWVAHLTDDPVAAAHEEARRLDHLNPFRLRLWRVLRGACFIDIFHASVVHNERMQQALNDRETP